MCENIGKPYRKDGPVLKKVKKTDLLNILLNHEWKGTSQPVADTGFRRGRGRFPPWGEGGGGVASPLVRNININNRLCKKKIKNVK